MGVLISKQLTKSSEYGFVWTIQGFKIAVVDDQFECRARIIREIKMLVNNDINIDEYESGEKFLYEDQVYDLVLLDIEMAGKDGFDTAVEYKAKHGNVLISFVTTHSEYWKKGYIVNAFRYIEKSNLREEIKELLTACQDIFSKHETVLFKVPKCMDVKVRIENIIYIETNKPYITIHTKQGVINSYENIKDISAKLERYGFMQCHRGYIINFNEVKDFDEEIIFLKNGERVQLSARKKKEFKEKYIKYKFSLANQ